VLKFNFAEVGTGKDMALSGLVKRPIGQLNFGIQVK
jgi:hypothetical protein